MYKLFNFYNVLFALCFPTEIKLGYPINKICTLELLMGESDVWNGCYGY